ncbi:ATP-binding protein [Salinivibrio kushneri]|uniref:AAA+ ATPase domain-containing protein n=1 Tax=Salinivibrio kushneri TaxID=1908198 RepID=A0AB36K8G4_9GAMM|nr:ATP-binding protein [Salinivibrio kushneri]OOE45388.1 hypothetical protein BZG09_04270 [Salinivibrio kushneri]
MLVEINDVELSIISSLFGKKDLASKLKKVTDIVFSEHEYDEKLLHEIDITGTFLLYGKTGAGKTTLAHEVIKYVENKYGVTPYRIDVSSIITSGLGDTLKNFESVFSEIKKKSDTGVLLLLDEFDRFVVDRGSEVELSELKRSLLSIMDFFSSLKHSDKIMLIAITNYIESIDSALLRRFSFIESVDVTEEEILEYYQANSELYGRSGLTLTDLEIKNCKTIADLKRKLRNKFIGES